MFNSRLLVYQRVHISSSGWWCNNHLEQYEFVNGKDYIPYMKWKVKHVWNHHPVIYLILLFITLKKQSLLINNHNWEKCEWRQTDGSWIDNGLIMDWWGEKLQNNANIYERLEQWSWFSMMYQRIQRCVHSLVSPKPVHVWAVDMDIHP